MPPPIHRFGAVGHGLEELADAVRHADQVVDVHLKIPK